MDEPTFHLPSPLEVAAELRDLETQINNLSEGLAQNFEIRAGHLDELRARTVSLAERLEHLGPLARLKDKGMKTPQALHGVPFKAIDPATIAEAGPAAEATPPGDDLTSAAAQKETATDAGSEDDRH